MFTSVSDTLSASGVRRPATQQLQPARHWNSSLDFLSFQSVRRSARRVEQARETELRTAPPRLRPTRRALAVARATGTSSPVGPSTFFWPQRCISSTKLYKKSYLWHAEARAEHAPHQNRWALPFFVRASWPRTRHVSSRLQNVQTHKKNRPNDENTKIAPPLCASSCCTRDQARSATTRLAGRLGNP